MCRRSAWWKPCARPVPSWSATTVPNMQATIEALHAAKLDCKVMVGGAVLTPSYAKDIGADYYCKDAKASADLAKQLLG